MKMKELRVADVLAGNNWILKRGDMVELDSELMEAIGFAPEDVGLFSSIVRFADGSDHPAVVVRSFAQGGDDVDIFILSQHGWMNIHTPGFLRALGKYSHEVFPFDYYLAAPWKQGQPPELDRESPHPEIFKEAAALLKQRMRKKA